MERLFSRHRDVRADNDTVNPQPRCELSEQELMIGRKRDSGAPLDGNRQSDIPNYIADAEGAVIPTTAHIRLANPRTPMTNPSRRVTSIP